MNHHKATLFFLLVFLFPLISPIVPAPPGGSQSAASSPATSLSLQPPAAAQAPVPPPPEGPVKVGGEYRYESAGTQLSTTEYSQGTNSSLTVTNLDYGATKDGMVRLPAGWTGYRMVADVGSFYSRLFFIHNVSDGEGPVRENGDFTSVGSEWSNQYSMGSYTNYTGSNPNWGYWWSSVGGKSGNGVRLYLKWDNGIQWQNTYYNSMYNTINIPWENPITFARLSFYARVNYAGNNNARGRLVIYVEVASKVYRLLLEDKCPTDNTWYLVTVEIPDYDLATWNMPGNIGVRIGLSWTGTQDSWDQETWYLDIDGANLEVRGLAQPFDSSWVALRMNATTNYDTSKPYGYGYATYTMSGTWPNPITLHRAVVARWTTTDTDSRNVDFIYNLTLYVTKTGTTRLQGGALGSTFSARNSSSTVYWKTYFNAQEPTYFRAYNLTINKPGTETWTKYQVWDPTPTDRTSAVTEYANRLELPNAAVNDMFGWWNFTFTSTNRVSSITTNAQTYRVAPGSPSSITVTATLISGTTSGEANLTIYRPDGLVLAGSEQVVTVTGTTVNFAAVSLPTGATAPAGQYTVCVTYDDDTSHDGTCTATRAGFRSKTVTVQHATNVWGDPASLQVVYGSGYFYPRVRYNDTDTSTFIEGATVTGNWTAATAFYQSGGFYEVQFEASGKAPGDYVIRVDASKTYYDSQYCLITVQVRAQSSLTSPQSPGVTKPYNVIFVVQVKYADGGGTGIDGAAVMTDWPGNPSGVPTGTPGWYNISINTASQPKPGTYSLTITAQKLYYQTQVLTLTIIVRERDTSMSTTAPATVPINEYSRFNLTLTDLDAGSAITNGSLKIHLELWRAGTNWIAAQWANYSTTSTPGRFRIGIDTSHLGGEGTFDFVLNFKWYGTPNNQPFHGNRTATVYVGVRKIATSISYTPPDQIPWGNNLVLTIRYFVDDSASNENTQGLTGVSAIGCTLDTTPLVLGTEYTWTPAGSGYYTITIYASKISTVKSYTLVVAVTAPAAKYADASRGLSFTVRRHHTQVVVDPPAETPYLRNTNITFYWYDLDLGGALIAIGSIYQVTVSGYGSPQVFTNPGTWTLTLVTNTWTAGTYSLNLAVTCDVPPDLYNGANSGFPVRVRIHYTSVVVQPPAQMAWGKNTTIVIQWTDLDVGGSVGATNASRIDVVTPFGNQTFNNPTSLTLVLKTDTWSINSYGLTVYVYAKTSPQKYSNANGIVTVVIRIHRVEVVVPTPAPQPWGSNTGMSVTWRDLDTESTIAVGNLKNITITNGPTGTQYFTGSFTFNLVTIAWSVGSWSLTVTAYPTTSPQRYEVGSAQVTVTIRAHYVSVTVDPPQAQPKGSNTPLVVHWFDVDTTTDISQSNLLNVTVKGTAPGLPYMATLLSFNLPTSSWSVGGYNLNVWVYANSNLYGVATGPVSVTIRAHATRLDVVAPSATPWGHYTHVELKWYDLDTFQYISGNLKNVTVTNCPDLITHTHYSPAFDLDTRTVATWAVGGYIVTVTLYSSSGDYQNAATPMQVTIRIHYTNVVVQPPSPTPWGTNTPMTVEWRDLDEGNSPISPSGNLVNVTVRKTGTTPQSFASLAFTLVTSSMPPWNIGSHTLNVTIYAVSTGRKYSDQWSTTILTIRSHRVTVMVTPPPQVPYEGAFTLAVQWRDIDNGSILISVSRLNYVRVTGNYSSYPPGSLPLTRTNLTFPVYTAGWARVDHLLNVTVYPLDTSLFDTQWTTFTVVLRKHNIGAAISPIAGIPYSNDTWFTLTVTDADTASSLSSSIYRLIVTVEGTTRIYAPINWTTYVKNQTAGVYSVRFLSSSLILGSHTIQLTIDTTPTFNDGATSAPVTIRQLYTAFTYTPPSQVPWDENGTLIVLYKIADGESWRNGQTLNASTITVDGLVSPTQYVVTFLGAGSYKVSFKASTLGEPGQKPYTVRSSAGTQYQSGTLGATMTVRRLLSMLTYSQTPTTPYGDPVIARVQYLVFDGESLAHNGQSISSASITVTGLYGLTLTPGVDYTVVPEGNLYRITITKSLAIALYHIRVNATHSSNRYFEASISDMSFNVRTVGSELLRESVDAAAYKANFTITITYRIRDDFSSRDLKGINDSRTYFQVTGVGWSLSVSGWRVYFDGNGHYRILLNSSYTPGLGTWTINITINRPESPPQYEEKTTLIALTTSQRPTQITFTRPGNTGYIGNITLDLKYEDVLRSQRITGASVTVLVVNVTTGLQIATPYWVVRPSPDPQFDFRILINATNLGKVGVFFDFGLNVSWSAGAPYYAKATDTFRVYIVGQQTQLIAETTTTTPYATDMFVYVWYNATTVPMTGITNSTGDVHLTVTCSQIGGWDHSYWGVTADPKAGRYRIWIFGNKSLPSGLPLTFHVVTSWTPQKKPYYEPADQYVTGLYREHFTSLTVQTIGDLYWGDSLILLVTYVDEDKGGTPVPSGSVSWSVTGFVGSWGPAAWNPALTRWEIFFDTHAKPVGTVSFTLVASASNYASKDLRIDFQIKQLPIEIQRVRPIDNSTGLPAVGLTYVWLQKFNITVYVGDTHSHFPITDAALMLSWHNFAEQAMYAWGNGSYWWPIDCGSVPAGAYLITIRAVKGNCSEPLIVYPLNIQRTDTNLVAAAGTFGTLTEFEVVGGSFVWIAVRYTSLGGVPIPGATITWTTSNPLIRGDFSNYTGGLYYYHLNTTGWLTQIGERVEILVSATYPNAVGRTLSYVAKLLFIPCVFDVVIIEPVNVSWGDWFTLSVYLKERDSPLAVPDSLVSSVTFDWPGGRFDLTGNGTSGWYTATIYASVSARLQPYEYSLVGSASGYQRAEKTDALTIHLRKTILTIVSVYSILNSTLTPQPGDISVGVNKSTALWEIPRGDTLRFTVNFTDYLGIPRNETLAAAYVTWYGRPIRATFDPITRLWTIDMYVDVPDVTDTFTLTFTTPNHEVIIVQRTLRSTKIPLKLQWLTPLPDQFYVGTTYHLTLSLNDTFHQIGVTGASIPNPEPLPGTTIQVTEWRDGLYNVTVSGTVPGTGVITFEASKPFCATTSFDAFIKVEYSPLTLFLIYGGSAAAIIGVIALVGWTLWARVFSIPWEVRRLRSLAKKVERTQTYDLTGKDRKHFRAREVNVEDTVGKAMTTIGVPVTAAMLPTTTEVAEVSATEEDLMGELDKIPGLGAEEKAVLAQEMRKIPRKDRIWFLDDLRRQMGERRMDFLTTKTPTPAPTPAVRAAAAAKPALVEAPKPVTAAKPGKPKEKVEKAEKLEKPKERVAPTVRPREEHVAPPPTDAVEVEIRRELDKIPGLTADEKGALLEHLKYLTPEERRATYQSLRQTADK